MEEFTILWSDQAKMDLFEIIEYIAFEDKALAVKILEKIEAQVTRLEQLPESGRFVPELKAFDLLTYREIVYSPWRIIYKVEKQRVLILAVLDNRRNLEDLLLKKLLLK
ncbi:MULTISPECIES: type II toxin-antitoxin system RelE/ParE family toxin [Acetobacterium]|jgi:addiction module RelE/StbE family toxin|uniref:type II toxin-antitoxin system RelE/ParE family toxin n=1 Tax=Acetobacterium TaxID=33951 RepID=UPI002034012D|nr:MULTISPECIES: type II toxin-antitoxin system RelE/ParE family toxin [Acetobacterium]URN85644.1 type II toxin-antitoxin system RelE/ParE family toxin [Acetobacterium wieringae]